MNLKKGEMMKTMKKVNNYFNNLLNKADLPKEKRSKKSDNNEEEGPVFLSGFGQEYDQGHFLCLWKKEDEGVLEMDFEEMKKVEQETSQHMELWKKYLKALEMDYQEPKWCTTWYNH
jgi:hypothetical protein